MTHVFESNSRPLNGKRILVCGKGGSGKSTLVALMATALQRKSYEVMVLDGDASNPEGLVRLLFGLGVEEEPKPLIEFFGGIDAVTCPVDDPSPLTRISDSNPVPEHRIDISKEISSEYYLRKGSTILLQAGKIETYGQGCDGPCSHTHHYYPGCNNKRVRLRAADCGGSRVSAINYLLTD